METKQVGVVSLPDVDPGGREFKDYTFDVLVIGNGVVIGGAELTQGTVRKLIHCWGVTDLVADHWWPLPTPGASLVEVTASGTSRAVRGALERAAAAWGKQVTEAVAAATSATRGVAHDAGRRQGTAEVVDILVSRLERNAAQGIIDQLPKASGKKL